MTNDINRTLLALLENQMQRFDAAIEGVTDDVAAIEPGGDCNSILGVCRHLLHLRGFQLTQLESPLADQVAEPKSVNTLSEAATALKAAAKLVELAISGYPSDDWFQVPQTKRGGLWGDEAMVYRYLRPFNDYTSHLGAIRAIRRMHGCPAERTQ